jgi:hypothetical protein
MVAQSKKISITVIVSLSVIVYIQMQHKIFKLSPGTVDTYIKMGEIFDSEKKS